MHLKRSVSLCLCGELFWDLNHRDTEARKYYHELRARLRKHLCKSLKPSVSLCLCGEPFCTEKGVIRYKLVEGKSKEGLAQSPRGLPLPGGGREGTG